MKNLIYILRMAGTILGVIFKRVIGIRKQPGWGFQTELMWATTRLTLLSSNRNGLPWLKKMSNSFQPKPKLTDSISTTERNNQAGSYLELEPLEKNNERKRILIYFHGGGYVTGNPHAISAYTTRLALRTQSKVLVPFYPTAPEHIYPAAHRFATSFVERIVADNKDTDIFLAGDSAGGALVISAVKNLQSASEQAIKGCILISPWVDPLAKGGSIDTNTSYDVGDREFVVACYDLYLNGQDTQSEFPLTFDNQNLPQLPPTFLSVGSAEILLDQTQELAKNLEKKGTEAMLTIYDGMFHTFWNLVPAIKEGDQLIGDVANWLKNLSP